MISEKQLRLFVGLLVWMSGQEVSGTKRIRERSLEAYDLPNVYCIRDCAYIDSIGGNKETVPAPESDKKVGVIEVADLAAPSEQFDSTAKSKKSIDGKYEAEPTNDLRTEEAKIFRPLFVYRQQIANHRRLRSDNNKRITAGRIGCGKSTRLACGYRFR